MKAGWCAGLSVCAYMLMFWGRMDFSLVPLFPLPPFLLLLLVPLSQFLSPPIIPILHWRAVSEPWMHYAVCSIVCAVSLCLCPTLSQYLFSLITMGACCGCLDGFFWSSFVPQRSFCLSASAFCVFFFFFSARLCVCVGMCVQALVHMCIYAHMQAHAQRQSWERNRTSHISLSSHMVMYLPFDVFFLLSGLITVVLGETAGYRMAWFCIVMLLMCKHARSSMTHNSLTVKLFFFLYWSFMLNINSKKVYIHNAANQKQMDHFDEYKLNDNASAYFAHIYFWNRTSIKLKINIFRAPHYWGSCWFVWQRRLALP